MRTARGFERLVAFADAIVAIAITLLVLPLVDLPGERRDNVWQLFADNRGAFVAFLLTFVVIARLWVAHHRITEYLGAYDPALLRLTLLWLLTVIFLPFPTELIGAEGGGRGVAVVYIATLLLSSTCLAGMTTLALRRPALLREGFTDDDLETLGRGTWRTPALFAVALVVAAAVPGVGLYALLILFADGLLPEKVPKLRPLRRGRG